MYEINTNTSLLVEVTLMREATGSDAITDFRACLLSPFSPGVVGAPVDIFLSNGLGSAELVGQTMHKTHVDVRLAMSFYTSPSVR